MKVFKKYEINNAIRYFSPNELQYAMALMYVYVYTHVVYTSDEGGGHHRVKNKNLPSFEKFQTLGLLLIWAAGHWLKAVTRSVQLNLSIPSTSLPTRNDKCCPLDHLIPQNRKVVSLHCARRRINVSTTTQDGPYSNFREFQFSGRAFQSMGTASLVGIKLKSGTEIKTHRPKCCLGLGDIDLFISI